MTVRWPALAATSLSALLAGIAYLPSLWPGSASADLGVVLFQTGAVPPLLAVAVAAYALRRRWARLPPEAGPGTPLGVAALGLLGTAGFAWAQKTGGASLLLPSLAANGLAVASVLRGRAGARAAAIPSLLLLFGTPLPDPLEDEVVWQLQLATTEGAGWLLAAVGRPFTQIGVVLRDDTHFFHVIDGCSGLNGILILTLVALLVRELFFEAGRRGWWLVAVAPLVGFVVNVVRVAFIAALSNAEGLSEDHTGQGLAVLMTGTVILYALGWALGRPGGPAPLPPRGQARPIGNAHRAGAVALCALLALLSLALPRFAEADRSPTITRLSFPKQKGAWISERSPSNREFHGLLNGGSHRRYRLETPGRPVQVVDLLVGIDSRTESSFRMFSSKLSSPGPGWDVETRESRKLWLLDRDVVEAVCSRGVERALTFAWRPRDRGLWRESWRSLLSLEASPFARERPRAAIRLFAYAPNAGPRSLQQARERLRRFIGDFREELDAI